MCAVVFTSSDTRIIKSIIQAKFKLSRLENRVNILMSLVIAFAFAIMIGLTVAGVFVSEKWQNDPLF